MPDKKDSHHSAEENELDLIPPTDPSWRLKRGASIKKPAAPTPVPSVEDKSEPSPHGTPAPTLYYGTSTRKEPPMSPTPTTTLRPSSPADYRNNIERQTKEQKSTGQLLHLFVYGMGGVLLLGLLLAGYGAYILSEQLRAQSVTLNDLQKTFIAQNQTLATQLNSTIQSLNDSQNQLARQQEEIDRLLSANQETTAALRLERQARQSLQARVQHLEQR